MLHELLFTLSGCTGKLFFKNDNGEVKLVEDVPFIQPSEAVILGRLCKLATHYIYFQDFIQKNGHHPSNAGGSTRGLYIQSFCAGLDQVLQSYRACLIEVEKELLDQPHLTVTYVQHRVEEFQSLFPVLRGVLQQIEEHKAHGCMILEILYRSSACGLPDASTVILRLLQTCHAVLYKQLAGWLIHGLLLDKYSEFFIQRAVTRPVATSTDDEDNQPQQKNDSSMEAGNAFCIRAEMLPSYIPSRVADKILFVGEVVHMFESDKHRPTARPAAGSIMKTSEDTFSRLIHNLSLQPFSIMTFEAVIDKIRAHVAERLWELVVEGADLIGELKTIKDYYLLGRGELFLAFIDHAQGLLHTPPSGSTDHDVNMAFQQATRSVMYDDDDLANRFTLTVDTKPTSRQWMSNNVSTSESGWNCLGLSYKVQWPLHILFTPAVLERYNALFGFLLRVRRVQLEIQHVWAHHQMAGKHSSQQHPGTWLLRNHMTFLVDNLQYYLQVDVIESQFSQLNKKIHDTRDFEVIALAHEQHITGLLAQSFLLSKHIWHCLNEILEICLAFCALITNVEDSMSSTELDSLNKIAKNFQRQSHLLFNLLASAQSHQASSHLAQLLLRLDYNKYYSEAGGQFGSFHAGSSAMFA